jgi:hypothetical protein
MGPALEEDRKTMAFNIKGWLLPLANKLFEVFHIWPFAKCLNKIQLHTHITPLSIAVGDIWLRVAILFENGRYACITPITG